MSITSIIVIVLILIALIAYWDVVRSVNKEQKDAKNHNSDYSLFNHDWKKFKKNQLN